MSLRETRHRSPEGNDGKQSSPRSSLDRTSDMGRELALRRRNEHPLPNEDNSSAVKDVNHSNDLKNSDASTYSMWQAEQALYASKDYQEAKGIVKQDESNYKETSRESKKEIHSIDSTISKLQNKKIKSDQKIQDIYKEEVGKVNTAHSKAFEETEEFKSAKEAYEQEDPRFLQAYTQANDALATKQAEFEEKNKISKLFLHGTRKFEKTKDFKKIDSDAKDASDAWNDLSWSEFKDNLDAERKFDQTSKSQELKEDLRALELKRDEDLNENEKKYNSSIGDLENKKSKLKENLNEQKLKFEQSKKALEEAENHFWEKVYPKRREEGLDRKVKQETDRLQEFSIKGFIGNEALVTETDLDVEMASHVLDKLKSELAGDDFFKNPPFKDQKAYQQWDNKIREEFAKWKKQEEE